MEWRLFAGRMVKVEFRQNAWSGRAGRALEKSVRYHEACMHHYAWYNVTVIKSRKAGYVCVADETGVQAVSSSAHVCSVGT